MVRLWDKDDIEVVLRIIRKHIFYGNKKRYFKVNDFESAEAILAEMYLMLREQGYNNEKNYSPEFVVTMIKKAINKCYYRWLKAHPNILRQKEAYGKAWHSKARRDMNKYYLKELLRRSKKGRGIINTADERLAISNKKISLTAKREKSGKLNVYEESLFI